MWPSRRILDLFGIAIPIVQAPMAGANDSELAIAVSEAGGLGSLPCAMLPVEQARAELTSLRATQRPFNVNFFCHRMPQRDPLRQASWMERLGVYYRELGIDSSSVAEGPGRGAFDEAFCGLIEEMQPPVVSFHFGLPAPALVRRVKEAGARILSSATCVEEARWLEDRGCDAIVAQGVEAGGHQGMFLQTDPRRLLGTMALVPQVVDAVRVPVIAAGGIADARGVAAAFALGADGVQLGTAYLGCPESKISRLHRAALQAAADNASVLTNVFTGRPARGIVNRLVREVGPMSDAAPEFPLAVPAIMPLRGAAEAAGSDDFSPLWTGQAGRLAREMPAGVLTRALASEALARLQSIGSSGAAPSGRNS